MIDANGEEVYYGHNASYQGGTITRDATGGYGPEEFALKVAKPGRYRVEANFFGHRQQVLTSGTGLMLWLSSGFGTAAQKDQRTTVRVRSERGERVVVGEFEVKAGAAVVGRSANRAASLGRRPGRAGAAAARRRPAPARGAGAPAGGAPPALARLDGAGPGLRRELRRDRLDLVLAHVVVHVAPAGEDGGAIGLLVDREAILDRPAGVAAAPTDRLAVGLARGGDPLGAIRCRACRIPTSRRSRERRGRGSGRCGAWREHRVRLLFRPRARRN